MKMNEVYKELLLIDVCARLPYGVKYKDAHGYIEILDFGKGFHTAINHILHDNTPCIYLRPMEDMTKEEEIELGRIGCEGNIEHKYGVFYRCQDYLNSHHLDYRGLIPKGLALKADKGMYKLNY